MWKRARLSLLLGAILVCSLVTRATEVGDNKKESTRWRWPDESFTTGTGAGRLVPIRQPIARVIQDSKRAKLVQPGISGFLSNPAPVPAPVSGLRLPEHQQAISNPVVPTPEVTTPKPRRPISTVSTTTSIPASEVPDSNKSTQTSPSSKNEPSTAGSNNKNNSVPLLKDAGKPGNPYILLNDIFPPKNFIRTKEEEAANLNSLKDKDIGNLDASEVWLADDDLFVLRGFNLKKPYSADPPGPPISDYEAPAPNPPPLPEPGTVFYPTNDTNNNSFNFFNPDFNSTDPNNSPFFPFVPGGLNDTNRPPTDFQNFAPPFPFLPPPPPHWTEEKEFDNNDLREPQFGPGAGNLPFSQGQGIPPPSGLNGFPNFPQFQQNGQAGHQPPPGFPPAGGNPGFPFGQGNFAPGPGTTGRLPPNVPGGVSQGPLPQNVPNGARPSSTEEIPPESGNVTVVDEEDDIPFTPLFPERPVEFYYPTHNTTAQPPGPFGPGIFVPPPVTFFAPRNKSEVINITIPEKLFRPPFNLPNYYQKRPRPSVRPLRPHGQTNVQSNLGLDQPGFAVLPGSRPNLQTPISFDHFPGSIGLTHANNIKVVPGPGPILLNNQFKEVDKLPLFPQLPLHHQEQLHLPQLQNQQPPLFQDHQQKQPHPLVTSNFNFPGQHPFHLSAPLGIVPNFGVHNQHTSLHNPGVVSLESDIDVNNKFPRPNVEPDSEIIDPSLLQPNPAWSPYSYRNSPRTSTTRSQFGRLQYQPQQQQPAIVRRTTTTETPSTTNEKATDSSKTPANYVHVYRTGGGSYSYPIGKRR